MSSNYSSDKKIWFPAKRYGLGWGLPVVWQGWVVIVSYFVLLMLGMVWLVIAQNMLYYMIYVLVITAILITICFIKGERLG